MLLPTVRATAPGFWSAGQASALFISPELFTEQII